MEYLNISCGTIAKIIVAGAFTYVIFPLLLVLRDIVVQWDIGKFVLTEKLYESIKMCEIYRFQLNTKYNKTVFFSHGPDKSMYKIDNKEVSEKEYLHYKTGRENCQKHFELTNAKVLMRHNLFTWLTKHYNQSTVNPIPDFGEQYYNNLENNHNKFKELRSEIDNSAE